MYMYLYGAETNRISPIIYLKFIHSTHIYNATPCKSGAIFYIDMK